MAKDNIEGLDPEKLVGTIPFESVIKIEVSGFYYARVLQLLTQFANDHTVDIIKMTEELKTREPETVHEYNFVTLVSLCAAIEDGAVAQNIIVEKPMKELIAAAESDREN